jgi:hypothetical protein
MHERLAVYVPDPDAPAEAARTVAHIDRGSGIVGKRVVDAGPRRVAAARLLRGQPLRRARVLRRYAERVMTRPGG